MQYSLIDARATLALPAWQLRSRPSRRQASLAAKVRFRFLLFLLVVLGLAVVLVMPGAGRHTLQETTTIAGIAALAVLSVWRHRAQPTSPAGDVAAAVLILVIGCGMSDHLVHVFGLAFVHLFVRALDVSLPRVALNAALAPSAYFGAVAVAHGSAALLRIDTATNLIGFAFVAGLMHTLAKSFAQQEQLEDEINFHALHDPLTGLPNRILFADRLEQALARSRRDATGLGLAFIDLDDFKDINDSFGHACGDRLLTAVGDRLAAHLRGCDTVARLGGDEFALILDGLGDPEKATAAVHRMLAALGEPLETAGRQLSVTASVGVAVTGGPDCGADELLRRADVAMYEAKAAGKGRCELYDAVMEVASHRRFSFEPAPGAQSISA